MSYYIEYNPELHAKYPTGNAKKRVMPLLRVALYLLITGMVVLSIFKFNIGYYFIPGDPEVTVEAFNSMIYNIHNGTPINDAVFSFCKEIVLNGTRENENIY